MIAKSFVRASELMQKEIKSVPMLWEPYFPTRGLVGLTGASDTGKSTLLRQLCIALCLGRETFLGRKLNPKHKSAIYISTEDHEDAISACLYKQKGQLKPDDLKSLKFIFNDQADPIKSAEIALKEENADVVIVDAWADLYGGNTNDVSQTRTALNKLSAIATKNKCLIIVLHHTTKNAEKYTPSKNSLNGSQGIEAKMRTLIELRYKSPTERYLSILKGNYISDSQKKHSAVLKFDEQTLLFYPTQEKIATSSIGFTQKTSFSNNQKLSKRIVELKECEGLSFQGVRESLKNELPNEEIPSLSMIKQLYKLVSQQAA